MVGVLTGAQTRAELLAELLAAGPTHVVDGVRDLPALLGLTVPSR